MKLLFTQAEQDKVIGIIRNPYRHNEEVVRQARLDAAELIERWQSAYLNMRDFAVANGLNVTASN